MSEKLEYTVSGLSCGHCEHAVAEEVGSVDGVTSVDVDLATKLVVVRGERLDDAVIRAAIDAAGYETA
jgi:copper chaperone